VYAQTFTSCTHHPSFPRHRHRLVHIHPSPSTRVHLHAIESFIPGQGPRGPQARDMHPARNGHENAARLYTSLPLWAEIIKETSSLQPKLLFLPARIKNPTTIVFNPLLKTVSLDFPSPAERPDLNTGCPEWPTPRSTEAPILGHFNLVNRHGSPEKSLPKVAYLRPKASWRRMLTQPPPAYTAGFFSSPE
jgi:hypothetical protein